jgi:hypothetical protein
MIIRVVSAILAAGALFWAVMLTAVFNPDSEQRLLCILWLGSGYAVTAWYIARVIFRPPQLVCMAMWCYSLLLQGGWLITVGVQEVHLPTLWWLFATVASAWAIFAESKLGEMHASKLQ